MEQKEKQRGEIKTNGEKESERCSAPPDKIESEEFSHSFHFTSFSSHWQKQKLKVAKK